MIGATIRPALRGLLRAPAFAIPAALTLALGMGGSTGAFTALRALVWNPLPYPAADRMAWLYETAADAKPRGVAEANLLDWRRGTHSFAAMAAYQPRTFGLTFGETDAVTVIQTGMVMAGFFDVTAVAPALGRAFTGDEEANEAHLLVLSDRLWRAAFGASRGVLGRKIFLNEEPFTIIGVMPSGFEYPMGTALADAFLPLSRRDYCCGRLGVQEAIARLRPGVSFEAAGAELAAAAAAVAHANPATNGGRSAGIQPLADVVAGPRREALRLAGAASLALLLIACANVAGLALARGLGRAREMAIRTSLGAGRAAWMAPMVVEGLALGAAGALGGVAAARLVLRLIPAFVPGVSAQPLELNGAALAFAAALALGVAAILALAPAWMLRRADWGALLKGGGRNSTAPSHGRARGVLVAAQVALGVMLLLSAGVLLRSLVRISEVNPGFQTAHALRFGIGVPEKRYDTEQKLIDFHHRLLDRLAAIPGVRAVGASGRTPLRGSAVGPGGAFQIAGSNIPLPQRPRAWVNSASPGYLEAMGIPLIAGRTFSWLDDQPGRQRVAVVNRAFVREYLEGRNPIGTLLDLRWVSELNPPGSQWEIVGVVGDIRQASLDHAPVPEICISWTQAGADGGGYVIRGTGDDAALARAVAAAVGEVDPRVQRISPKPLESLVEQNLAARHAAMRLVGGFGLLALLLAALGVYGAVAFRAAERQREMAIRVALGASGAEVRGLVLGHGLRLAAMGAALGIAGFVPASRLLEAQVYGVSAHDPASMFAAALVAVAAAVAASLAPALRAARCAPMELLREG